MIRGSSDFAAIWSETSCTRRRSGARNEATVADNRMMVTKKPKGLGMGLEALLGPRVSDSSTAARQSPTTLTLDQLRPGRYQPRTRMDEGSLYELAQSIRTQGLMQPILVRPVGDDAYEIIAGERRFRAARLAGLDSVPVLVKVVADEAAAVMALIENIQREDLNPLEEAQGLQRLVTEFQLTHEQAAQAVGRSRSAATNLLRLLKLAESVQQMLLAGDLDMGHARALLPLEAAHQVMAAQQIAARQLSVREAERLVARFGEAEASPARPTARQAKPRDLVRLEEQLADRLLATVEIRLHSATRKNSRGEIAITFGSMDELQAVLQRLGVADA
jgi:ParB family chromosome partitioning protein